MAFYQKIRYCIVPNPSLLGDGICNNIGKYNTAGCNFDNGDCQDFNKKYPPGDCEAPYPFLLNDSKCDGPEYNNPGCNFDGGDCLKFNEKYPNCTVERPYLIGNGKCDGELYNTAECGYDGGDCLDFWGQHPNCVVDTPRWVGDDYCHLDGMYNTADCNYDNGDCDIYNDFIARHPDCQITDAQEIKWMVSDSSCDTKFNTPECGFDGGDCKVFNEDYPNCTVPWPGWIGDGACDDGLYNTAECGFDGGDCEQFNEKYPDCSVSLPFQIGDGTCDGGLYNTVECGFDGGDCAEYNEQYPKCSVEDLYRIGDGNCDHGLHNTAECGFDNGDCEAWNLEYSECTVEYVYLMGNGVCNGPPYNSKECLFDGGDCLPMSVFDATHTDCLVNNTLKLGDGVCDGFPYNTTECGYDNGDCSNVYTNYPNCDIFNEGFYRDGTCHPEYNTQECGYDGGDCDEFNLAYPNCKVDRPWRVGTGTCSGRAYNTIECGFDGGDCDEFNEFLRNHPKCNVSDEEENWIGTNICDMKYNTPECAYDNGDCEEFNSQYPGCPVENIAWLGDGKCDGLYNTPECAYDSADGNNDCEEFNSEYQECYGVDINELGDGICQHNSEGCNSDDGDCDFFNALYPECKVSDATLIGDDNCHQEYNIPECKYDGGDCLLKENTVGLLLVDGNIIGVDQYQQNTRTNSIIQMISSSISLVASMAIIWIIRRSYRGFSVPPHRLLLGISVADICSSFAQSFGTLPAPDSFDVIWNARGMKGSCQAQGFLIFLGAIAAPLYNCSLCFYYLVVIRYKGKNADSYVEKKVEKFLHAIPIGVALIGAITILSMDAFHPNMTYCFIGSDPQCEGERCEGASRNAKILFVVFSAGPYFILPCVIIVSMAFVYKAASDREKKNKRFGRGSIFLSPESTAQTMSTRRFGRGSIMSSTGGPSTQRLGRGSIVSSKGGHSTQRFGRDSVMSTIEATVGSSNQNDGTHRGDGTPRASEMHDESSGGNSLRGFLLKMHSVVSVVSSLGSSRKTVTSGRKTSGTTSNIRLVLNRALSYSLAFFLTYLFPIIISIRTLYGKESGPALSILARIFFPLQGFFNFLVFILPRVVYQKSKRRPIESPPITWYQAFLKAIQSRGRPLRRSSVRIKQRSNRLLSYVRRVRGFTTASFSGGVHTLRKKFMSMIPENPSKDEEQAIMNLSIEIESEQDREETEQVPYSILNHSSSSNKNGEEKEKETGNDADCMEEQAASIATSGPDNAIARIQSEQNIEMMGHTPVHPAQSPTRFGNDSKQEIGNDAHEMEKEFDRKLRKSILRSTSTSEVATPLMKSDNHSEKMEHAPSTRHDTINANAESVQDCIENGLNSTEKKGSSNRRLRESIVKFAPGVLDRC